MDVLPLARRCRLPCICASTSTRPSPRCGASPADLDRLNSSITCFGACVTDSTAGELAILSESVHVSAALLLSGQTLIVSSQSGSRKI